MPDENRVFDVSKPSKVSPSPTSRPVIVGHHPMNDPMVREEGTETGMPAAATKIQVSDEAGNDGAVTVGQAMDAHEAAEAPKHEEPMAADHSAPAIFDDNAEKDSEPAFIPEPIHQESVGEGPFTETEPAYQAETPSELPPPAEPQTPHIEGLHVDEPRPKGGRLKWVISGIILILVVFYLLVDSGLVSAGFQMPFHIFKQKSETTTSQTAPPSQPKVQSGPVLPAGFKNYKLADTNITFAAPTAWGEPTSTTDPGYSQRGSTNQPTGTYAYLVNFSTNKDIQVAVTSNKYLPAARAPQYYDFLQWCLGTNDNKIYQAVLKFSTTNKVDTPTTVTCDQGPLASATAINDTTMIQTKVTDTAGKVIGDVYTINLKDPALVVLRVKDASMTNGTDIKQLLGTVKVTASSNTTTSSSSGQ